MKNCGVRVFIIGLFLLSSFGTTVGQSETDNELSYKLGDMKILMETLNSKITALDTKMADLNILEYAFKMNNIENQLTSIHQLMSNFEGRIIVVESQVGDIKELISGMQLSDSPLCEGLSNNRKKNAPQDYSSNRSSSSTKYNVSSRNYSNYKDFQYARYIGSPENHSKYRNLDFQRFDILPKNSLSYKDSPPNSPRYDNFTKNSSRYENLGRISLGYRNLPQHSQRYENSPQNFLIHKDSLQKSPEYERGPTTSCVDLIKKIDDYSYKIAKSQQELKDGSKQYQTLNNILDTVRTGFVKSFQKVDLLPNIEKKLMKIYKLSKTVDKLSTATDRLSNMEMEIKRMTQSTSSSFQESNSRLAASLNRVIGLGERVKKELETLPKVELDVKEANRLAKDLLSGRDSRRPITADTLKTLTTTIENIESITSPLFFSISKSFEGMYELLNITLNSFDHNETRFCNFHDIFKFEMNGLIERLENKKQTKCADKSEFELSDNLHGSGHQVLDSPTKKQQEIIDNLNYVRTAAVMVKTDLQRVFQNCPDGSISTTKPITMVLG